MNAHLGSLQRKHSERLAKLLAPHEGQGQSPAATKALQCAGEKAPERPQEQAVFPVAMVSMQAGTNAMAHQDFTSAASYSTKLLHWGSNACRKPFYGVCNRCKNLMSTWL